MALWPETLSSVLPSIGMVTADEVMRAMTPHSVSWCVDPIVGRIAAPLGPRRA